MGALVDHECAFRPWVRVKYEGKSKLYTDAWNEWPTAVQDAQCLAKDGQPFNDNPAPAVADSGRVCENQDMTSNVLHERVFGRSHIVVYRTKTIIMDATNRQEETLHGLDATIMPQIRQGMMSSVADMNYYGEPDSEEWSFAATVISSSVRGDTFMSPMHTNSLKHGHVDHGQVHWISARGSIVDDLATTKAQMKKIAEFGSKVIAARHGSDARGEEVLSELVLLGDDFNDEMLEMLDSLKNSFKATRRAIGGIIRDVKVPLLYRLVVVNPNGFTNDMKERLFGPGKVFEGRVPVRSFTGNNVGEIEVVVFPVALSTFWPHEAYGHYSKDFLSICTAYSERLDVRIGQLKNKRYVNEDLQKFVTRIWRLKTRAEADNISAAGSESHNDQGSASAALGVAILRDKQALQRNVLQKSDLNECGETSVPVKLFEIGLCTDSSCKYAGPVGFGCACGKGFYKPHVRGVPKERTRFPNEFLDSSSDSESSSDESLSGESSEEEDDSRIRKRKLAAAKSVNKVKKPKRRRSEKVETLKKQYHQKFGELPKGRYASDVAWLNLKLSE